MVTIVVTETDLMRRQVIDMDRDAADALACIHERLLPEVTAQQGQKMPRHLDGGKGSIL